MKKEELLEYLNELIKVDQNAIVNLIGHRVACNEELAKHPNVQVMKIGKGYKVGLLGILNGLIVEEDEHLAFDVEKLKFVLIKNN
jgi:hypothetical protein